MLQKRHTFRIYGEQQHGQWSLICLELCLASQADALQKAELRLHNQIKTYLDEATSGIDREHASSLLNRRAPLQYWIKYYWCRLSDVLLFRQQAHLAKNHCVAVTERV